MKPATAAAVGIFLLWPAVGSARAADDALVAQIFSTTGKVDRAKLAKGLKNEDLQKAVVEHLPAIERAVVARRRWDQLATDVQAVEGRITFSPGGPEGLRKWVGKEPMRLFDVPSEIDLYNGNNPLKGRGGINTQVDDAWLKRLRDLTTVTKLSLANCEVSGRGLQHVATMTHLEELNLTLTPVTDADLKPLGALTRLRVLGLASSQCSGTGFEYLRPLKDLQNVNFHYTPLNDAGLEQIAQVGKLQRLWMAHTHFTDQGARHLARLKYLKRLGIGSTDKASSGKALAAAVKLPLEELDLLDRQCTDQAIAFAAQIPTLWRLNVSHGPQVTDAAIRDIVQMPALTELSLGNTAVTDQGLGLLTKAKSLKKLTVRRAKGVTEQGIAAFKKARPEVEAEFQ